MNEEVKTWKEQGYPDWYDKALRIHLAGYYNGKSSVYDLLEGTTTASGINVTYPWYLESYHYVGHTDKFVKQMRFNQEKHPEHRIFLDSGAFSMFTQGVDIDMPAYVNFIKENGDVIDVASVLDGIGDAVLTFANQKKLEDMGVDVLPCFHYGEPDEYLEYYLKHYDHITIGGMVMCSTKDLMSWLDRIWKDYMTDDDGLPIVKVHGFGITALSLMLRYPWFSVDSTSWVLTGRFGSIFYPTKARPDGKLVISDQSPQLKSLNKHYDTLCPDDKASTDARLASLGFTAEELRTEYWKRDLYNVSYFKTLTDKPVQKFNLPEQHLWGDWSPNHDKIHLE